MTEPNDIVDWNYRVVVSAELLSAEAEGPEFVIHEVYYLPDGTPEMWTLAGVRPSGDSVDDLEATLNAMLLAIDKPILCYETGEEYVAAEDTSDPA